MRTAQLTRKTKETDISIALCLDGDGTSSVASGSGFFDHMLTLFAKHARINLTLSCKGDTEVDFHHSAEDIGIILGEALDEALGDKRGICRYGDSFLPMDESLVLTALDLSGRSYLSYYIELRATKLSDDAEEISAHVGDFDTELVEEFFAALTRTAKMTLHIQQLAGKNTHHILEAVFKGFGRALRSAVAIDTAFADDLPTTKGVF